MEKVFDLDAIEARANAATPGRWRDEASQIAGATILADGIAFVADDVKRTADAIFIAHASPRRARACRRGEAVAARK